MLEQWVVVASTTTQHRHTRWCVSNLGNVEKSIHYADGSSEIVPINQIPAGGGYLKANFGSAGKWYVHRLVAVYFCPLPENWDETWQVNHKNEIVTCNTAVNLEWITQSENIKLGKKKQTKQAGKPRPVLLSLAGVVEEYPSISAAAEVVGVAQGYLSQVLNAGKEKCKNYNVQYKEVKYA